MKKTYVIILLFLILLMFTSNCKGNFSVNPRELSIKMLDEFIQGNTSKKIIISNNIGDSINISWYIDNPTLDLIRENKTLIPSISWIRIEPQWKIILPNSSSSFYVFLDIPEHKDNYNKHWESWPVFKQEESQFFNWEHAVRLYIDTPEKFPNNEKEQKDFLSFIFENFLVIIILAVVVMLFLIILYFMKFKNHKQS